MDEKSIYEENIVLGYRLQGVNLRKTTGDKELMQLEYEETKVAKMINDRNRKNLALVKKYIFLKNRIQSRFCNDNIRTPSDLYAKSKEDQILYLRKEIVKLEYQQLAESIVSIKGKTPANKQMIKKVISGPKNGLNKKNLYSEYEITFDESIKVPPAIVDFDSAQFLDKQRQNVLLSSVYDAVFLSSLQITKSCNQKPIRTGKRLSSAVPIKQITHLLDDEILGRVIDFKRYGLCHYCKQIKPLSMLLKCHYKSIRSDCPANPISTKTSYKGKARRSEERRVGKACLRLCISRWSPYH